MDGLSAKRVLVALARKFGYTTVRRANKHDLYVLKFVDKKKSIGTSAHLIAKPLDNTASDWYVLTFNSAKWNNILNSLVGNDIAANGSLSSSKLPVHTIEQLVIDLELDGFLNKL